MQQRLSKLEAAQRLGVSPSTLDRMIRRGELEIEREGRGDRAKVWVLAHDVRVEAGGCQRVGLSATVPGVEPVYRRLFAGISVMQPVKHHPAGGFHCGGRIGPSEEFQGALGCRSLIPNGSV